LVVVTVAVFASATLAELLSDDVSDLVGSFVESLGVRRGRKGDYFVAHWEITIVGDLIFNLTIRFGNDEKEEHFAQDIRDLKIMRVSSLLLRFCTGLFQSMVVEPKAKNFNFPLTKIILFDFFMVERNYVMSEEILVKHHPHVCKNQ
jgi:hypothetical protein